MKKTNAVSNNKDLEETIKKDNKRAGKRFAIMMLFSIIAGAIIGIISIRARFGWNRIGEVFEVFMTDNIRTISFVLPTIAAVLTIGITVWSLNNIKDSKKNAAKLIEEDDENTLRKIEKKLSYNMWITSGLLIFHFFIYSIMMFSDYRFGSDRIPRLLMYSIVVFMTGLAIITLVQQKLVDCIRLINPEKKGSVYDLNFNKKWEESCDEAEKLIIYKAAYKAYKVTFNLCIFLWVIFIILGTITGTGFLPAITVLIIWAVMLSTYCYYSIKYEY